MHTDVIGFLPPTEPGRRPQFLLKVVLAQIKRDHRRAVFHRRAHKGVLVHFCDSRRKLHLHGYCHLASFATPDYRIRDGEDSSMTARGVRLMVDMMSRKDRFKMLCVEPGTHPMICQPVTLSGYAAWPKVADAVIEAHYKALQLLQNL